MFDRQTLEAKFALGLVHPEDLVGMAVDALCAGLDGVAIRRAASLENPSGWEFDQLRSAFMQEAGIRNICVAHAALRLSLIIAEEGLRSNSDITPFTDRLEHLARQAEYPSELCEVGFLSEEIWVARHHSQIPEVQVQSWAREQLGTFVAMKGVANRSKVDS